jgi:hypothetical protein
VTACPLLMGRTRQTEGPMLGGNDPDRRGEWLSESPEKALGAEGRLASFGWE